MTDVMMGLGDFKFSLSTAAYKTLRRSNEWRWVSVARFGRKPALQPTGAGTSNITMNGDIYPHYAGGLGQLDAMRAEAEKQEPLRLAVGNGRYWGQFVIVRINEGQSYLNESGQPRKQTFELELKEYGDDAV